MQLLKRRYHEEPTLTEKPFKERVPPMPTPTPTPPQIQGTTNSLTEQCAQFPEVARRNSSLSVYFQGRWLRTPGHNSDIYILVPLVSLNLTFGRSLARTSPLVIYFFRLSVFYLFTSFVIKRTTIGSSIEVVRSLEIAVCVTVVTKIVITSIY